MTLRNTYRILIGKYFCQTVFTYRIQQDMTQVEMAERLCMDERSYIDLEHGKNGCSVVTLMLFLMYECSAVDDFLRELRDIFEEANDADRKEPVLSK